MYKVYFRQAIQILRQNKFISFITIAGTALAIMMIMAIIVSYEIKIFSGDAEPNRHRTLYIDTERIQYGQSNHGNSPSVDVVKKYLGAMKTPECISITDQGTSYPVKAEGNKRFRMMRVRSCDSNYWKIMKFNFINGRAFTKEELESEMKVAVISESTAIKLFNDKEVMGKTIEINFEKYRIIGIVKDISPVYTDAFSNIWVPYTSSRLQRCKVLIIAHNKKDFPAIIEEVREAEKLYSLTLENSGTQTYIGPNTRLQKELAPRAFHKETREKEIIKQSRKLGFIIVILILVPAVNLWGFSFSRVRKRMAEIGIRKAFGAKKHTILIQVLYENMLTSLIGGIIGLILSYLIIFNYRNWLLGIPEDSLVPLGALISIPVWVSVFAICLLLNLLSAGIPAYIASKTAIVDSLYQNYK